jgi:hypothetical protein
MIGETILYYKFLETLGRSISALAVEKSFVMSLQGHAMA